MQPDSIAYKVLNKWSLDHDEYEDVWYISHYVGGEDCVTHEGPWDTKEEAEVARVAANAEARTYQQNIYY